MLKDGQSSLSKSPTSGTVPEMQEPQLKTGMAKLRGLGSIRLSHLTDETTSPVRQREAIGAYVEPLPVEMIGWAEDLNVSAAEVEPFSRPELGPWLTNRADKWDVVIFAKQDRAARTMQDMNALLTFCKKHEKVLIVCEDPGRAIYDFRAGVEVDPFASMWAQLGAMFFSFAAELEIFNIKQRVRSMRRYLREHGEWGGGRFPFGYEPQRIAGQKRGWRLVVHEETAAIVRDIIRRIVDEDQPLLKIAEDLNRDGVPTPFDYWDRLLRPEKATKRKSRSWSVTTLGKMMRSRALLGEGEYEGRLIRNEEGEPVLRASEGLISVNEWDRLQISMAELSQTKIRYSQESETLGIAHCGECGGRLYAKESVAKGRTYEHLVCRYRQKQYGSTCTHPAISKKAVELLLRETFMGLAGSTLFMRRRYVPGDDRSEELASVVRLKKSLQKERDLGLQDDDEDYFERLHLLVSREKDLRATPIRKAGYVWEPTGQTYGEAWEAFSPSQRREILSALGIRIYVGLPGRFSEGKKAWSRFSDHEVNMSLPGERWFAGAFLSDADVERVLDEEAGERFTDGLSSGQRIGLGQLRRYKTKPFQFVMVREGVETVTEKLNSSVAALRGESIGRHPKA